MSFLGNLGRAYDAQRERVGDLRRSEVDERNLSRMREQDRSAVRAREDAERNDAIYREGFGRSPTDLPAGGDVPTVNLRGPTTAAPARAPAAAPLIQRPAVSSSTLPSQAGPDQSDAESKRLASVPTNKERYSSPFEKFVGGAQREVDARRRYEELRKKNPATPVPNQSNAETARISQQAAATAPAGAPAQSGNLPRGLRNNNPGNIEFGPFAQRHGATSSDGRFAIFPDAGAGEAAADALLQSYAGRGLNTVGGIVGRWSPQADPTNAAGSTNNYVRFVSQKLGVSPDQPLDMQNPQVRQALANAKFEFENGRPYTRVGQSAPAQPSTAEPGAPAQTPAAQPTQAPQQLQQGQFFTGQSMPDEQLRMTQYRMQELQRLAPTLRGEALTKARTEYDGLMMNVVESRVSATANAAQNGDMRALSQLAAGAGIGLAQANGGVVAVNPQTGQVLGQPMPVAEMATQLYNRLSQVARQRRAAVANVYQTEQAKSGGKAAGEHPFNMELERQKGANQMNTTELRANYDMAQQLQRLGFDAAQAKITTAQDGQVYATVGGRVFRYVPNTVTDDGVELADGGLQEVPRR